VFSDLVTTRTTTAAPNQGSFVALRRDLLTVLNVVLAAACAVGVLRIVLTIGLPVLYGSDEGWSAYHQLEAVAGLNPYPPHDSLMYNVYPPLGFYIFGVFGGLTGDFITTGRLTSLVAFLLTTGCIGLIARSMGCNKGQALFASLIYAAVKLFDHDYIGTNTPQTLSHAFAVAGLLLCLRERRSNASLFVAALLFVAAFGVKHNMIVAPLAVTLWLAVHDRRGAAALAASTIVIGLAGLVLFYGTYGVQLWSVLNSGRVWLLSNSLHSIAGRLPTLLLPIGASIALWRLFPQDRYVRFGVIYLPLACAFAVYFLGGSGTGGNQLFDIELALALNAGLGLSRLSRQGRHVEAYALCFFLPALLIVVFTAATGRFPRHWLNRQAPAVVAAQSDIAFLKAHPGPALCRQLALCFWAGKTDPADLWNIEQSVATGRRDGHELKAALERRDYAVLQLCPPPNILSSPHETRNRYSDDIAAIIAARYRMVDENGNGAMWVRRNTSGMPTAN
jgi:hypothetical protein